MLGACSSEHSGESSLPADKLIIISAHNKIILKEYERSFKEYYKKQKKHDIVIEWLDQGGASKCYRFIQSRFSANPEGIGIDLFWGGGTEPYIKLTQSELLAPVTLPPDTMALFPKDKSGISVFDPKGRWYGTALATFGIIFNKKVLSMQNLPEPQTWKDLADPRYCGWVGLVDPRQSGSARMVYEILLQGFGWEEGLAVIQRMGGNSKRFYASSSEIPREVALGEIAIGMSIDYYAYSQIEHTGPEILGFVLPADMTAVTADAIAMLKGAPNPGPAKMFIEFVLSTKGQEMLMLPKGIPGGPVESALLRTSVFPSVTQRLAAKTGWANPFILPCMRFDKEKANSRMSLIQDLIGALVFDNASHIREFWKKTVCGGELSSAALSKIDAVPVSENEAIVIAKQWADQKFRYKTIASWQGFVRKKFHDTSLP